MRSTWNLIPVLLLIGCSANPSRPPPPPTIIEKPVPTFVPIRPELLVRCAWRESAPLAVMPAVASERRACLLFYEAHLDAIGKIQGKADPASP